MDPRAGQPAEPHDLIDVEELLDAYAERTPDVEIPPAGRLRYIRTPGLEPGRRVQRGAHPGHHPGDLRVPRWPGHVRPAAGRPGQSRPVRAGLADGARGARGQRRTDAAWTVPTGSTPTPGVSTRSCGSIMVRAPVRTASSSRRRTTRRGTAASSTTRHTAGRRLRRDRLDRGPGQRADRGRQPRGRRCRRAGAGRRQGSSTSSATTWTTCRRSSTSTRSARRVKIGADPLGGASVDYWAAIAERYGLDLTVVNPTSRPAFRFMTLDHDGKIRMDCSWPYAMASLVAQGTVRRRLRQRCRRDRHGIVTPDAGLINPNHYLAVAIEYLLPFRPVGGGGGGKTLVSSRLIDRVVAISAAAVGGAGRLQVVRSRAVRRSLGFGGEESGRGEFPAPRRERVDDGQGRPSRAAGGGDHRVTGEIRGSTTTS